MQIYSMNPNQFTHKLQESLQAAQSLAASKNHSELTGAHLIAALLAQGDGATRPILEKAGGNSATIDTSLTSLFEKLPSVQGNAGQQVYMSQEVRAVMNTAEKIRAGMQDEFTSV